MVAQSTKRYTSNCQSTPSGPALANGVCTIPLPATQSGLPPGLYHVRLYHQAGNTDASLVQTSNEIERVATACEANPQNCSE